MTQSAHSASDAGETKALAALPDASLEPFSPKPEAGSSRLRARLLDYSAHAAMIVGLIGFAWTVGAHVVHRPASLEPAAKVAALPANDPMAELRSRNRELTENVHTLQARVEALQTAVGETGKVAAQVRVLQAGLDTMKSTLGAARSEGATAMARLDGKVEKIAREPGAKFQQLNDRLGKLEHAGTDPAPTASLPRPADKAGVRTVDAQPVPRPTGARTVDKETDAKIAMGEGSLKPQIIANWVVREVYQGVALVEGRRGTMEVVPGVSIPGAGVVKSIDRHGAGWTVTTTKGLVAYAAPARDNRRADRGFYGYGGPAYNYDF